MLLREVPMGFYVNPGNDNFKAIVKDDYVDKTGLASVINNTIGTQRMLSCVSRPRRFGKSYAAKMLAAYYDCSVDSHALFKELEISRAPSYEEHINKYHVLYLDISGFMSDAPLDKLPAYIRERVIKDLRRTFPDLEPMDSLKEYLSYVVGETGRQFIAIIDEWDAPIRANRSTADTQLDFLEFLRSLFKSDITQKVFAAAYMTGILPIKKDGSQSAISEFEEYTILDSEEFAPYAGFLEHEVEDICRRKGVSFESMKEWYNGYTMYLEDGERISIYNPSSVMRAAFRKKFKSYWGQSSAAYGALDYINLDFDGLGAAAEKLTAGWEIPFQTEAFKNDLTSLATANDVLTLLTHYISYDSEKRTGRSPNHEILTEFGGMIHRVTHKDDKTKPHHCRIEPVCL